MNYVNLGNRFSEQVGRREPAALVGVHNLWWAELVDGLIQGINAELGF